MQAFGVRKHYEEHLLIDSILEKTYPKLFEQMPREFFKQKMMEVMDDEILAYSIAPPFFRKNNTLPTAILDKL